MRNRVINFLFSLLLSFSATDGVASSLASDLPKYGEATTLFSDSHPSPCELVYPSKAKALKHCPSGSIVKEWYDFWLQTWLGWVCDCSRL